MSLTAEQKTAGRAFRAACQSELDALNAADPPAGDGDPLLRVVRHQCSARRGASHGIALREHYQLPGYWVCYCGVVRVLATTSRIPTATGRAAGAGCSASSGRTAGARTAAVLRSITGTVDLTARRPPERTYHVAG